MDTEWEKKFPTITVHDLERIEDLSDRAPLLFSVGLPPKKLGMSSNSNLVG